MKNLPHQRMSIFKRLCAENDLGFRIQDSGFRIQDSGFRIQDSEFRIQNPKLFLNLKS
jgi:hypothetical protein